jgi:hypothetical protein
MNVLYIGAPVESVAPNPDFDKQFNATGQNTGNLLIGNGLLQQIECNRYFVGTHHQPEFVAENCQLIAIPAANWIYQGFDFGWLADYLERIRSDIPILVVGLGAQMPSSSLTDEVKIPDGSKRMLKIMAERCVEIGVRGEFTASVLNRMGIKNVRVTGCPSFYTNCAPTLEIQKEEFHEGFRVSINGSRNVYKHSFNPDAAFAVESELLRISINNHYDYVLQNEKPEMQILHDPRRQHEFDGTLQHLSNIHGLGVDAGQYVNWIKDCCKVFYSIREWTDYIRYKDLSIGSRFHGNLIALLNGVPAILIAHDSRTREMAEFMRIPHVSVEKCDLSNLRPLYESADFDAFSKTYKMAYIDYADFFGRNYVPNRL